MDRKKVLLTMALAGAALLSGCTDKEKTEKPVVAERDCLYQVSTIQALTAGDYYGSMTVGEFLKHGDIAIGTFEGVNGEMIVLDGECYQALADGTVAKPEHTETVPFGAITFFDADYTHNFKAEMTFDALKTVLDSIVNEKGANTFYVGRIEGVFPEMSVRSIAKQKEPYPTLDEAMKADQKVFDYKDQRGTLIAAYCPAYAAGVNAGGWHLHFLSEGKDKGGHVLAFRMSEGKLSLDRTDKFHMELPDTEYFNKLDLMNQGEAVKKVEQGG
ncbi:MAG: acetolactate decarboxylase [Bacteroidaceae bacterium]|nr:acetolactate decarboxylase [Bacteroidaceae bacterium]